MKKKTILPLTVVIVVTVAIITVILIYNKISRQKSHAPLLISSTVPGGHIFRGEVLDTILRFKRDTIIDFQWVFRQLYPVQHIGRENHPYGDAYIRKLLKYYPSEKQGRYINCDSVNNFLKDVPNDTIFLKERINKENSYSIHFWHRLDSVYTIDLKRDRLWHVITYNLEHSYLYKYTDLWMKALLKDLGCRELPPGKPETTDLYSICATRIILTPDSVFMDMFKFYRPYALEERYREYR